MKKIFLLFLLAGLISACTNLEEELRQDLTAEEAAQLVDVNALLEGVYNSMRQPYQDQARWFAAQEHTGDACIGPTRGGDWDDNGIWRSLHNHQWTAEHDFLAATFSELLQVVFATTNLLQFNPSAQQAAEARFVRAYVMLTVADGWDQVPFREAGSSLLADADVLTSAETVDFVVSEIDAIINDLPDGPKHRANKDAARVLKMKALLNKGVYTNRANPSFDNADMQAVATIGQEIINSGRYSLASNFYDNFAPDNDTRSTENIWTSQNIGGVIAGNVRSQWFCTLHYNQNPSGWNGFTTLAEFYDSFEDNDMRRGMDYDGVTDVSGLKVGLLLGQQLDQNGNNLQDRNGNPLSFTRQVALRESGSNLEVTGIRVVKYPPDFESGDNVNNDYVYYRYADVVLTTAEALHRSGNSGMALNLVNQVREARNATPLASLNEDALLAERGREFYWENQRRTDLIRFGKFLSPWSEKPASGSERLVFPIPVRSLAANPNLRQNPGY
jgi:starch-binding outer membrane protein, SusD/RagB family